MMGTVIRVMDYKPFVFILEAMCSHVGQSPQHGLY